MSGRVRHHRRIQHVPKRRRLASIIAAFALLAAMTVSPALAADSLRVESSSGGGTTACKSLGISELFATFTKGVGGHAFVDLSVVDTCGGAGFSIVAFNWLAPGDLHGNRNRISLRTTLIDEGGSGRAVTMDVTFRCWASATVSPGEASCPATLSGRVTVDGTVITLDPSTDAFMSSVK